VKQEKTGSYKKNITYRMCDVLQRIHNAVSIVITRIDTPLVSWMWSELKDRKIRPPIHVIMNKLGHWWYSSNYTCLDSISNEVMHIPIITLHVLLHSECRFAFFKHALSHFFKKFQRFCNRSIPPRKVSIMPCHVKFQIQKVSKILQ